MNTDDSCDNWIRVQYKVRKYKARIQSIHMPGSNLQKQSNLSQVLATKDSFLGCKLTFYHKETWISAIFKKKNKC
jgi:hypothetical protein